MRTLFKLASRFLVMPWLVAAAFGSASEGGPRIGDVPPRLDLGAIVQGPTIENVTWDKLQGKVVVLEFWNTACVPCIAAIPHLNELVTQFSQRPVVFLSISDDNRDHLKRFLTQKPIAGWLALDAPLKPTTTAFAVVGIPHTVILDQSGKIAAITHPALLKAQHLEEILAGKRSALPPPDSVSPSEAPVSPVADSLPQTVEVSITGPFPKPDGAYASRGWRSNCVFTASKAPVDAILAEFFHISPKLLPKTTLPEGLYDVLAAAPPDRLPELPRQFIQAAKENWKIEVQPTTQEISVYVMTVASTNAPGLKPVQKRGGGGQKTGGFFLGGQQIQTVASYLESSLDKPVIDETGLQGLWAADLTWEMSPSELSTEDNPDPAKVIKAARTQLGLDLRPALRKLPTIKIRNFGPGEK